MKLFHWKSQGINLLVMAESVEAARGQLTADVNNWRWQNPGRFDQVLEALRGAPYFECESLHTITIDMADGWN